PAELALTGADDREFDALGDVDEATLGPGQILSTEVMFDVPEQEARVRLHWRRASTAVFETVPPEGLHPAREPKKGAWPQHASDLPAGDPARGRELFAGKMACFSCHGDPSVSGTNTVGPSLADIGMTAGTRVSGFNARQYLYESILD